MEPGNISGMGLTLENITLLPTAKHTTKNSKFQRLVTAITGPKEF